MRISLCIVTLTLLSACGKPDDPPPVKIMEAQRQQLQKAKDVEKSVQKAADTQRQEIDAQTASQSEK
jgi:hypothetical protein